MFCHRIRIQLPGGVYGPQPKMKPHTLWKHPASKPKHSYMHLNHLHKAGFHLPQLLPGFLLYHCSWFSRSSFWFLPKLTLGLNSSVKKFRNLPASGSLTPLLSQISVIFIIRPECRNPSMSESLIFLQFWTHPSRPGISNPWNFPYWSVPQPLDHCATARSRR